MFSKFALGLCSNPGQERFFFILAFFFQIPYIKCLIFPRSLLDILLYNKDIGKNPFLLDIQRSKENIKRLNAIQFYMRTLKMKRKNYKKRYSLAEFKPKPRAYFGDNFRVQFLKDLLSIYYLLNLTFKMGQKSKLLVGEKNWLEW